MAEDRDTKVREALRSAIIGEDIPNSPSDFRERTASEIANPVTTQVSLEKEAPIHSFKDEANVPEANRPVQYHGETASEIHSAAHRHKEETAAEIAAPVPVVRGRDHDETNLFSERADGGVGYGTVALALSILSLFVLPILFGALGIVFGFVARARGASALGAWAIGIGVVSLIIGIFILPFF